MHERPQRNLAARLPWTVSVVAMLILGAISTRTYIEPLGEEWYESWGSSPADLMNGDLQRLFSSPVLTPGQGRFYISLFMAAICVGAAEWLEGTFRAIVTFLGVHTATLSLMALTTSMAMKSSWIWLPSAEILYHAVDVGPSAGYYGCLGLVLMRSSPKPLRFVAPVVMVILLSRLVWSGMTLPEQGRTYSADLAHAVAFPLGCIISVFAPRQIRPSPDP